MESSPFAAKFVERLGRIDREQIETFLRQVVREKDLQGVILDSLPEGVVVADRAMRVVFANEASRSLLGLGGRQRLTGAPLREVFRAPRLREVAVEFEDEQQPIRHREVRVRTPEPRIYAVTVAPIRGADGELSHSVWIVFDQTETYRRAAERHQADSIRSLAMLTSGIAHEIKNPLNSLNIHAQLIEKSARDLAGSDDPPPAAERLQHSAQVLLEEISRVARIVDQFIKSARPARLELRRTRLDDILTAVAHLIGPECRERRIELTVDHDPEIPSMEVDAEQLRQALLNVAKNAMEAIDKPEGSIALRSRLRDDHVLIEVEDNGCGIPERDRMRIFEPYHTTKFEGTGLGLMVVFNIISAHRGAIGIDSEVGRGTIFKIALPLGEKPVRLLQQQGVAPTAPEEVAEPETA